MMDGWTEGESEALGGADVRSGEEQLKKRGLPDFPGGLFNPLGTLILPLPVAVRSAPIRRPDPPRVVAMDDFHSVSSNQRCTASGFHWFRCAYGIPVMDNLANALTY